MKVVVTSILETFTKITNVIYEVVRMLSNSKCIKAGRSYLK